MSASHVVDVDDVVDVVVLEHDLLPLDLRLRPGEIDRVVRRAEIGVDVLVAVVEREPVEPDLQHVAVLRQDLDVRDVVAGAGLGQAGGARPVGLDPEDPVLQAAAVVVVDQ
jgi:hypothetical protein